MILSDKMIEDLIAMEKKATGGPWQTNSGYKHKHSIIEGISKSHKVDVIVDDGTYDEQFTGVQEPTDAQMIVALRNAAASLLDEVNASRDVIKDCESSLRGQIMGHFQMVQLPDGNIVRKYIKSHLGVAHENAVAHLAKFVGPSNTSGGEE